MERRQGESAKLIGTGNCAADPEGLGFDSTQGKIDSVSWHADIGRNAGLRVELLAENVIV